MQAVLLGACASGGKTARHDPPRASEAFFDLHQAVGFLEAYESERCATGLAKAQVYLNMASDSLRRHPSPDLASIAVRLRGLTDSSESAQLLQVEQLRERLHAAAAANGYEHSDSWNQEFWNCR